MPPLELPRQSNPGRYGADGAARLINCHPESRGREGKAAFGLYASDGLKLFSTLAGGGGVRGMISVDSNGYVVSGRQVFKVDQSGVSTALGGFPGDGPVFMARNQKATPQICMVGAAGRFIIENDIITSISDTDLPPPNSVVFHNQRFVLTIPNGRFHWSGISDGLSYNSLDFATAEYAADGLVRGVIRRSELLLFGTKTIEPWYTPGSGNSTYLPSGSVIERGCLAGGSVAMVEGEPMFVADDSTVRLLSGYQAVTVSNHAVERSIRDTASPGEIRAFSFNKDGHSFYVLSGVDFSWQFDLTTKSWVERISYGLDRWRAESYMELGGKRIVGDYSLGNLYEVDGDTYDENGDPLIMTVQIPVHAFPRKIKLSEFRVDTIPGQGTATLDPKLIVKTSKNGGKTFGNERHIPMGKIGEYFKQVRVNGLGMSKEDGFVISVSSSAAVVKAVISAFARYQIMEH